MADPRFFNNHGPFPLASLVAAIDARLESDADGTSEIADVAPLDQAGSREISFFDNPRYLKHFTNSRASACLVPANLSPGRENMLAAAPAGMQLVHCDNPSIAYAHIAALFYPQATGSDRLTGLRLSLEGAYMHPSARLEKGAIIEAGAVIGAHVRIGAGSCIGAGTVIGQSVAIGRDCLIGPQASITHALIGDRVVIHPGVRIGQDGYGFVPGHQGHIKLPQLGRVIIQDDVEIGANTTIDRGAGPDTVIGQGSKIDNLCMIAHNVKIGRHCLILGQVGISGSAEIGDYAIMAGQAATVGHVKIGEGAQIAARGGVTHDLAGGKAYGGYPARPLGLWKREIALLARLARKGRPGSNK
jgi:UDP-3-O-[3-hydroxymyristoyl] glucosamine N-acyltransferase